MPQTPAGGPHEPDGTTGPGGSASGAPGPSGSPVPGAPGGARTIGDGRYRMTRRLGRGGMAEVFAAEDVRLGREVAVKLMRSDLAEDPVAKARFTREAQSVAGLNHHAVVAVYDSGEEVIDGNVTPYIVMELVEGHTIRDLLQQAEAPPVDQALVITAGVLEALAYSHQHGIVHRDIKPANVIITESGAVKVMDFGIARAMHGASTTMTQTGMVMGTPQYLSPEQALGKTVDTRSDLYATGCLLYELLALRPPFTGETPLSVVYQHVQDAPRPPSEVTDDVPPELDGLVIRSLAKDPDDRFQTAEEMRGTVLYALRMLQEQGGDTGGLWNTGPVALPPSRTPVSGTPTAATAPYAPQGHRDTSQLGPPLLMGRPDRDDGGFEGGPPGGASGRGGSGVKWALIAFLLVIAVAGGIFWAGGNIGDNGNGDGGTSGTNGSTSGTQNPGDESTEPTDETTDGGDDSGGTDGGSPTETGDDPTKNPTDKPTKPTEAPSGSPSETTGGNTSEGSTDEGNTSEGNTDEGNTSEGNTDEGNTSEGNTDEGNTSEGNTDEGNTSEGSTDQGNTSEGNTDTVGGGGGEETGSTTEGGGEAGGSGDAGSTDGTGSATGQ